MFFICKYIKRLYIWRYFKDYMQRVERNTFPKDHTYYRTSSPVYRKYMESPKIETFDIGNPPQFWWKKKLFGNWFQMIKYERIDIEPDIEWLKKKFQLKHAWIIWIPEKRTDIPLWWKRFLMQTHFIYASITTLQEKYREKWNQRGKRARKKFLESGINIELVDGETFTKSFKNTPVRHMFKSDYLTYYQQMSAIDKKSVRSYIAYYKDIPIAGLAVHDYHKSSVHMVAFTNRKYYKFQSGTWLIDRWFSDSLKLSIQYIDFDRVREKLWPKDQQGYTDFKNNFIEFQTNFTWAYFKIF